MTDIIEGDLIEAMARAMCDAYGIAPDAASMGRDNVTRSAIENRIKELRAAVSAAAERGYVLVPKEPTEEMKRLGGKEGNWCDHHVSSAQYHLMAAQEAEGVWRAMIAAGRVG